MVDIVDRGPGVDQLDEILDDLDDVGVRQNPDTRIDREAELLVQAVAAHASEVIALLGEEELVDDVAGGGLVRRFGVAELLVDEVDSFDLRIGRVLLQGVVDDGIFRRIGLVLLQQDGLDIGVKDLFDGIVVERFPAVDDGERTFDGDHLTGVLVLEVLGPRLEDLGGEETATVLPEGGLVGGDLISESEDVDDILVAVVADGPQQGGHGQLLLPVDVGIHHAVDVRRELDPGALEGDDAGGIQLGPVGVHALVEEHARGPVELGNDDALRSVDDEGAGRRHVRDVAQIHVLDPRVEVFVLGIGAGKAEFRLQGDIVGEAPLKAFLDRILGRIDEVIDKAEFVVVPRVLDRENFLEYLEQTLVAAAFGRGLELEEVPEGLELDLEKVRILQNFGCCEIDSLVLGLV